jgi:predicted metal-dependent phosphoesterase TrpH
MIAEAGGVTVLAHPFASSRGPVVGPEVIEELTDHGLTGIEIDHPDHDEARRAELRDLATRLDLVPTGSSDYHGTGVLGATRAAQLGEQGVRLKTGSRTRKIFARVESPCARGNA